MKTRIGEIWKTKNGESFEIIESLSITNCTIRFDNGTVIKNKDYSNIKAGRIKNPYFPSVFGVGYVGNGKYEINSKANVVWRSMLSRCYNEKQLTKASSYRDCSVDINWHNFQNFAEWFEENYNPETMKGWQLDKDILIKGNRVYRSDACCFVPKEINYLFIKKIKQRGKYPIGVVMNKKIFNARVHTGKKTVFIGSSDTSEIAFLIYKSAKEQIIKNIAEQYKEIISLILYNTLLNYQVEITD